MVIFVRCAAALQMHADAPVSISCFNDVDFWVPIVILQLMMLLLADSMPHCSLFLLERQN
jgi:hypothetical protein